MTDGVTPAPEPVQGPVPAPAAATDSLDPKVAGLLSYLLFGWIGGLIMFLTQKHPEVRFHGMQSILLSAAWVVLWIGLSIVNVMMAAIGLGLIIGLISVLIWIVLGIGGFALWVILCIKGYNLEHFKLPFIGDLAEKFAAGDQQRAA